MALKGKESWSHDAHLHMWPPECFPYIKGRKVEARIWQKSLMKCHIEFFVFNAIVRILGLFIPNYQYKTQTMFSCIYCSNVKIWSRIDYPVKLIERLPWQINLWPLLKINIRVLKRPKFYSHLSQFLAALDHFFTSAAGGAGALAAEVSGWPKEQNVKNIFSENFSEKRLKPNVSLIFDKKLQLTGLSAVFRLLNVHGGIAYCLLKNRFVRHCSC